MSDTIIAGAVGQPPEAPTPPARSSKSSPRSNRRSVSVQPVPNSNSVKISPVHGDSKPLRLRIVIAGPESAGKSCIIKRYCEKRFVQRYMPTIGIDYGATKIYIDKREVSIHIFDTSGASIFREVRNEFYKDTHGIILVFDVGNRDGFDALCQWTREVYMELVKDGRDFDNTVVMVCANKCDTKARQVDEIEAKLWAELRGFPSFETSALSGQGINDMFHAFFSQIVRIHDEGNNGLPKTPSTARKVHLTKSPSNTSISSTTSNYSTSKLSSNKNNSNHRLSNSHVRTAAPSQNKEQPIPTQTPKDLQPSCDQQTVMDRLRSGRDPYQQMGLVPGCSKDEVNRVYRKLAVLLHPDKTAVAGADEAFKTLGIARRNILKLMGSLW